MFNFFRKYLSRDYQEQAAYQAFVSRLEKKEIAQLFTRHFTTEDGKKVLAYLQYISFHRVMGPQSTDAQLRYAEGYRAAIAMITRLIDQGQQRP